MLWSPKRGSSILQYCSRHRSGCSVWLVERLMKVGLFEFMRFPRRRNRTCSDTWCVAAGRNRRREGSRVLIPVTPAVEHLQGEREECCLGGYACELDQSYESVTQLPRVVGRGRRGYSETACLWFGCRSCLDCALRLLLELVGK